MYEFNFKIRFSETDEKLKLTIPSLLNYFQDCSTFQSESLGDTIENMKINHCAWVLVKWQVEINRMPSFYDDIVVGTIPYSCNRCNGQRSYYMKDSRGEMFAYADTSWALVDTNDMKLIRVTDEMKNLYATGEKIEVPKLGRRIEFGGEAILKTSVEFSAADQDTNHHVNNVKTVTAAWQLVKTKKDLIRIRTEFRKQLFSGESITATVYYEDNRYIITFENSDGEITTVCEFTTE